MTTKTAKVIIQKLSHNNNEEFVIVKTKIEHSIEQIRKSLSKNIGEKRITDISQNAIDIKPQNPGIYLFKLEKINKETTVIKLLSFIAT